jgi:hypothetical protein
MVGYPSEALPYKLCSHFRQERIAHLWQQLAEAQQSPQAVDWEQLCLAFDVAILTLQESDRAPIGKRLATAAEAIEQMADVLAARASAWAEDWYRHPGDGPVLDEDLFSEFVRQSFSLDLSDFVAVPELYVRSAFEKSHEDAESVVEYREKTDVLAELESFVGAGVDILPVLKERGFLRLTT